MFMQRLKQKEIKWKLRYLEAVGKTKQSRQMAEAWTDVHKIVDLIPSHRPWNREILKKYINQFCIKLKYNICEGAIFEDWLLHFIATDHQSCLPQTFCQNVSRIRRLF